MERNRVVKGSPSSHGLRTTPERSRIMRAVRRDGTPGELRVREALHRRGVRYRVNVKQLPGSPDIANKTRHFVIFVHGCFWHRHSACRRTTTPKTNRAYWGAKFKDNIARDRRNADALRRLGYHVHVVWECEALEPDLLGRRVEEIAASIDGA